MQLANSSTPTSSTLRLRDVCRLTVLPLPVVRDACCFRLCAPTTNREQEEVFCWWGSCNCSSSRARTQMLTWLRTAVSVAAFVVVAVPILIRADTHTTPTTLSSKTQAENVENVCVLFQVCADLIAANERWGDRGGGRGVREMVMASRLCQPLCALVYRSIMCLICHNRSFRKLNWPQNRC